MPAADEATCRRYYEANRARFRSPDLFAAQHILFAAAPDDDEARTAAKACAAEALRTLADSPDRFADLARAMSDCPSREQGGDLGQITRGSTVPEFETFLMSLDEGETCPVPVESRYGFHIVKLNRRATGRELPFEQVQQRIADYLADAVAARGPPVRDDPRRARADRGHRHGRGRVAAGAVAARRRPAGRQRHGHLPDHGNRDPRRDRPDGLRRRLPAVLPARRALRGGVDHRLGAARPRPLPDRDGRCRCPTGTATRWCSVSAPQRSRASCSLRCRTGPAAGPYAAGACTARLGLAVRPHRGLDLGANALPFAVIDLAFLPLLTALIAPGIIVRNARRNGVFVVLLALLWAANAAVHLDALGVIVAARWGSAWASPSCWSRSASSAAVSSRPSRSAACAWPARRSRSSRVRISTWSRSPRSPETGLIEAAGAPGLRGRRAGGSPRRS